MFIRLSHILYKNLTNLISQSVYWICKCVIIIYTNDFIPFYIYSSLNYKEWCDPIYFKIGNQMYGTLYNRNILQNTLWEYVRNTLKVINWASGVEEYCTKSKWAFLKSATTQILYWVRCVILYGWDMCTHISNTCILPPFNMQ